MRIRSFFLKAKTFAIECPPEPFNFAISLWSVRPGVPVIDLQSLKHHLKAVGVFGSVAASVAGKLRAVICHSFMDTDTMAAKPLISSKERSCCVQGLQAFYGFDIAEPCVVIDSSE